MSEPKPPKPFQFEERYKSRLYWEYYAGKISWRTFRRRMATVLGDKHYNKILSIGEQLTLMKDKRIGPPAGYFLPKEYRDTSASQNLFLS